MLPNRLSLPNGTVSAAMSCSVDAPGVRLWTVPIVERRIALFGSQFGITERVVVRPRREVGEVAEARVLAAALLLIADDNGLRNADRVLGLARMNHLS